MYFSNKNNRIPCYSVQNDAVKPRLDTLIPFKPRKKMQLYRVNSEERLVRLDVPPKSPKQQIPAAQKITACATHCCQARSLLAVGVESRAVKMIDPRGGARGRDDFASSMQPGKSIAPERTATLSLPLSSRRPAWPRP